MKLTPGDHGHGPDSTFFKEQNKGNLTDEIMFGANMKNVWAENYLIPQFSI